VESLVELNLLHISLHISNKFKILLPASSYNLFQDTQTKQNHQMKQFFNMAFFALLNHQYLFAQGKERTMLDYGGIPDCSSTQCAQNNGEAFYYATQDSMAGDTV
jgi:hypothetical protein